MQTKKQFYKITFRYWGGEKTPSTFPLHIFPFIKVLLLMRLHIYASLIVNTPCDRVVVVSLSLRVLGRLPIGR